MRKEPTSLVNEVLYSISCELPNCVFVGSRFRSRCTSLYRLDKRYRGDSFVPKSREVYIVATFDNTSVHELAYLVSEGGCWITIDMSDNIDDILAECDWSGDEELDRLCDSLANYCASSFEDVWSSAKNMSLTKLASKPMHKQPLRVMLERNYCCEMSHKGKPTFHDAAGPFHTCVLIKHYFFC